MWMLGGTHDRAAEHPADDHGMDRSAMAGDDGLTEDAVTSRQWPGDLLLVRRQRRSGPVHRASPKERS